MLRKIQFLRKLIIKKRDNAKLLQDVHKDAQRIKDNTEGYICMCNEAIEQLDLIIDSEIKKQK